MLGGIPLGTEGNLYSSPQQKGLARAVGKKTGSALVFRVWFVVWITCSSAAWSVGWAWLNAVWVLMLAAVPAPLCFSKQEQVLGSTVNTRLPVCLFPLFLRPCKLRFLHGNVIKMLMVGVSQPWWAVAPRPPGWARAGPQQRPQQRPQAAPAWVISPAAGRAREDRGILIYKLSVQMFSLWFAVHWCHLVGGELNWQL